MSRLNSMLEEYNDSFQDAPQTANKFNLAKRDFELFKEETPNGDVYEAKLVEGNMFAIIGRTLIFTVHLDLLPDEDREFMLTKEGFLFVIGALKRKVKTEEDFRCLLDCHT